MDKQTIAVLESISEKLSEASYHTHPNNDPSEDISPGDAYASALLQVSIIINEALREHR